MLKILKTFILKVYRSDHHSENAINIYVANMGVKNVQCLAQDEEIWSWIINIDLFPVSEAKRVVS